VKIAEIIKANKGRKFVVRWGLFNGKEMRTEMLTSDQADSHCLRLRRAGYHAFVEIEYENDSVRRVRQ
jgi:hypothetical protein